MIAACLIFLSGLAWAVHPAASTATAKISQFIAAADVLDRRLSMEEARFIAAEGPVPRPDFNVLLEGQLKPIRDKRDELMLRASREAMVAFGLVASDSKGNPVMPSGSIEDPILKQYGRSGPVTWDVSYQSPPPAVRKVVPGFGVGRGRKPDLNAEISPAERRKFVGVTAGDGVTIIWPAPSDPKTGIRMTPAELALLLHHELQHFKLKTTSSKTGPLGPNREEVEAYKADIAAIDKFGFSPRERAEQVKRLSARRDEYRRAAHLDDTLYKFQSFRARLSGFVLGGHGVGEDIIETSVPGVRISVSELNAIQARARELDARIAADDERRRRDSSSPVMAERQPLDGGESRGSTCASGSPGTLPTPCANPGRISLGGTSVASPSSSVYPADDPSSRRAVVATIDRLGRLRNLASSGCRGGEEITQEMLDSVWPGIRGVQFAIESADALGLSGCERNLFLRLMRMASDDEPLALSLDVFRMAAAAAAGIEQQNSDGDIPPAGAFPHPEVPTCRHHAWCREWSPE